MPEWSHTGARDGSTSVAGAKERRQPGSIASPQPQFDPAVVAIVCDVVGRREIRAAA